MIEQLHLALQSIAPVDRSFMPAARAHLDNLTKPQGSLGRLEDLAADLFCMSKGTTPLVIDPVRLYTIAGDHGVTEENISAFPQEVTRQMVYNFLQGGAAVNVLGRAAGIDQLIVDVACKGGPFPEHPKLIQRKIAEGTANFVYGPAMTEGACAQAVLLGMELAQQSADEGFKCIGIGEIGIGNTTAATALFAAYLKIAPAVLAGPGSGLNKEGVHRKALVVQRALNTNTRALTSGKPLAILAALGGYEIATMTGLILGAAQAGLPCLVDGFIAQSACVAAVKICPAAEGFAIFTHASAEPGSLMMLPALNRAPLLSLDMRLGEGTGSALAVHLLRAAVAIYNEMATFDSAEVATRADSL